MWWWVVYKYVDQKRKEKYIQIHFWCLLSTFLIRIYPFLPFKWQHCKVRKNEEETLPVTVFTECSLFVKLSKSEHFWLFLYIQLKKTIFFRIQFCSFISNMKWQYLRWNVNNMQIFNFHFVKSHNGPALVLQIILTAYWGFWWSLWLCKKFGLSKRRRREPLRTLTFILDSSK